jgi:tripartite motif-containing protein 71
MKRMGAVVASVAAFAVAGCSGGASATPAATAAVGTAVPVAAATPAVAETAALPTDTPGPSIIPAEALKLLWQKGGPTTVQTETYCPVINPITGNIWVASGFQNQYWIFKPDGTFVGAWGVAGSGPGQLDLTTHDVHPDGVGAIAFAPDGTFYVADVGNYRVEKFDKNGKFLTMWGSFGVGNGQFGQPKGIVTDGKTVFVADDPRGDIQQFDPDGHFIRALPINDIWPAMSSTGDLLVRTDAGIEEFDQQGNMVKTISIPSEMFAPAGNAGSLTLDAAGNAYAMAGNDAAPGTLVEVDPQGHVLHRWSVAGETEVVSPDGHSIYMAYTGPSNSGWPYIKKYALP